MIMVHQKRREMTIGLSAEKVRGNICFSESESDKPCLVFLASQRVDKRENKQTAGVPANQPAMIMMMNV